MQDKIGPRGGRPRAVQAGDLLLACVKADGEDTRAVSELLPRVNLADVPEAARYHRVVAAVHDVLSRVDGVDAATMVALAALRREGTIAAFRVIRELHRVRSALAGLDVPWLVVKGPVLSEIVYARRGIRTYHDLDVLVRPRDFAQALAALEREGYRLLDPNWNFHRRWVVAELRLASDEGADVDLHWHLLFARQIRRSFRVPIADLVGRAREVSVQNVPVLTLDEADTLIHLTIHACREGGDRLYWLKDIEQSIVNERPRWDDVVTRAQAWRVNILVGTMLARTRAVLGAPVPKEVVRELLPRPWRGAARTADRFFPPHHSTARGTLATLLAHGARDGLPASASAITREVLRMLRQLAGGEPWRREEWNRGRMSFDSPDDPMSKLFAAGDERDREWLLNELLHESSPAP